MASNFQEFAAFSCSLFVDVELRRESANCGQPIEGYAKLSNSGASAIIFGPGTKLSYHWHSNGRTIVWDGLRTALPARLQARDEIHLKLNIAAPPVSGKFNLHVELVEEGVGWWSEFSCGSTNVRELQILPAREGTSPHFALNQRSDPGVIDNGLPRPKSLVCETTNICNLSCSFCAYSKQSRAKGIMSMALFSDILNQYAKIGGGELSFTSTGEVLLDPLLSQRLKLARESEFIHAVSATTNATVAAKFSDEQVRSVISPFDHLQVSIYGLTEEENFQITGKRSYMNMKSGLRRILEGATGKLVLAFRTAASRMEIENWIERNFDLRSVAADLVIEGPVNHFGNFASLDTSAPPFPGAYWLPDRPNKVQCVYPAMALKIFWDGNVSLCPCADFDHAEELSIGNVRHKSIGQILRGEKNQKLWNWARHGVPHVCRRCTHYLGLDDANGKDGALSNPRSVIGG